MKTNKNIFALMVLLLNFINISYFMIYLNHPPHLVMILCMAITSIVALFFGHSWKELENGIVEGIRVGVRPIFLLLLIGILISIWIASGAIPTLLCYGINLISPQWFTLNALFISIIISTFSGSSLSTVATVGVVLVGIAEGLNMPLAPVAGAIVCGSFFGDKISPISDTTNFAPGIVGIGPFEHIRSLLKTTIPALFLTIIFFYFIDEQTLSVDLTPIYELKDVIEGHFFISFFTLLSPLIILILAFLGIPSIPTIFLGILVAIMTALLSQPHITLTQLPFILMDGHHFSGSNPLAEKILNRGGLNSMLPSTSLIFLSLCLGGLLTSAGILETFLKLMIKLIKTPFQLVLFTGLSSIGVNFISGEQYLSILLPAQSFLPLYDQFKVPRNILSRTLEDCGTLINPIVPWGVCGIFVSSTLQVPVLDYIRYSPFILLSPLFTFILAYRKK